MSIRRWNSRDPLPEDFRREWNQALARAPMANFAMRLDFVEWEARIGIHSRLLMEHRAGEAALLVLREVAGELRCGWPWRVQAVTTAPAERTLPGMGPDEAQWLSELAQTGCEGVRVRLHLPHEPFDGVQGFRSGVTIIQSLRHTDEELLQGMDSNKRRLHRRALKEGFTIRPGVSREDFARYGELDRAATRLRNEHDEIPDGEPAPGQGWREWELPWMQLLVAERDGVIEACVGDGWVEGGVVDGRSAVTSAAARQHGVMALLCHREACWLRDRGHAWFNHGGDTTFKREISGRHGQRLLMWTWLRGGAQHAIVNHAEALLWRARPMLASWVRSVTTASVPRSPGRGARAAAAELERRRAAALASALAGAARSAREWDASEPLPADFARAWQTRLDASAGAHFAMRLDWMQSEAAAGHPMRAVLLDEPDLQVAAVIRRENEGWSCGWPWRTQFVLEDAWHGGMVEGPKLRRVLDRLSERAAPLRLRMFVPRVPHGPRGTLAGRTLLKPIGFEDEELMASLNPEKRRAIRKAEAAGWSARLTQRPEDWRAFHEIQLRSARRRGETTEPPPRGTTTPEPWLEWGLPWHWLFVAERDGVIQAGSGFGWGAGGVMDYRTNASEDAARKAGANVLLAWRAMLHARDQGCHWVNWGGYTVFKRQFGEFEVEMHSVLGGGSLWTVPNQMENAVERARRSLTQWVKRSQSKKGKTP